MPNGSFENYSSCPTSIGQSDYALGWNTLSPTPDYYNGCSTSTGNCIVAGQLIASVPYNCFGFQYAASGNAYQGFAVYSSAGINYREILGAQLTNTLIIGQKYYVKFKIVLTLDNSSNSASDKTGIRLSTVQHNSVSATPPLNNFAHIYSSAFVTDTANWTTIFKSFVADSNYAYVEVGNFFDDANTNIQILKPQGSNISYYYFDDFCLSTDSLFALNYSTHIDDLFRENKLTIYPNPSNGKVLRFNTSFHKAEVSICDIYGHLIKSVLINSSDYIEIDLRDGIYFVIINDFEKTISQKIVINNE